MTPTLVWFRRDLRLSDHLALSEAVARGGPVIAVFVHDASVECLGAAAKWRFGLALEVFQKALAAKGSRLVLRKGAAREIIPALAAETGAGAVHWSRLYDPDSIARDTEVMQILRDKGVVAQSFAGHLLFEPWVTKPASGPFFRVYTPFYKSLRGRDVAASLPPPGRLPVPEIWPASDGIADWRLGAAMNRATPVLHPFQRVGEEAAQERLDWFCDGPIADYERQRDQPAVDGTSGLSDNLAWGEISPRQCWHAGQRAFFEGKQGAETYLKELVWREFAYHLMYHSPHILTRNWRAGWDDFPWNTNAARPDVVAWTQGRTGVPFVDAAMRELYVTGKMHNRARMIAASYLTKHLLSDWRIGQAWFADCLTDWDSASNAMGWQWVAGCGPDASPYFRIFNPVTQQTKFDARGAYVERWIAEGRRTPAVTALSYFDAVPRRWGLDPAAKYPAPVMELAEGRQRALAAYQAYKS